MEISDIKSIIENSNIKVPYEFCFYIIENLVERINDNQEIISEFIKSVAKLFSEVENRGSVCIGIDKNSEFYKNYKDGLYSELIGKEEEKNFLIMVEEEEKPFLYLYKDYINEKELAASLKDILKGNKEKISGFEDKNGLRNELINKVLENRISFITGGPGTGKTTLAIEFYKNFIKKFKESKNQEPVIKVCAPTGKASKVLGERISKEVGKEVESFTIHRLLGYSPYDDSFLFNKDNKLVADLIIVDEASMIDLYLFNSFLKAINEDTKLIIIGDKDQLPSVGVGSVFADLVESLSDYVVELKKSYRTESKEILERAGDVNKGDFENLIKSIKVSIDDIDNKEKGIYFVNSNKKSDLLKIIELYIKSGPNSMILTFTNKGFWGSDNINDIIIERYKNKIEKIPIIITANDYENNLFNGDILLIDKNGEGVYINKESSGSEKRINLNLVKSYKYAFAITVHKSQGSEYDNVYVILPDDIDNPLISRQILYTAITRAKKRVVIIGMEEVFKKCVEERPLRISCKSQNLI